MRNPTLLAHESVVAVANLQLLQGQLNQAKSDQSPAAWIAAAFDSPQKREEYIERHLIEGVDVDIEGFLAYYDAKRIRLIDLIEKTLNS